MRPEDIALAAGRIDGISIQNQIPATVRRLREHGGRVLVEVAVSGKEGKADVPLLVEITPAAAQQLAIAPGRQIWCLIKSTAIEWLDEADAKGPRHEGTKGTSG
jgi:molybdopterin-binding protein